MNKSQEYDNRKKIRRADLISRKKIAKKFDLDICNNCGFIFTYDCRVVDYAYISQTPCEKCISKVREHEKKDKELRKKVLNDYKPFLKNFASQCEALGNSIMEASFPIHENNFPIEEKKSIMKSIENSRKTPIKNMLDKLSELKNVVMVGFRINCTDFDDKYGLPPFANEIIVDGGDEENIAQTIADYAPIYMLGEYRRPPKKGIFQLQALWGEIKKEVGGKHVYFSRPSQRHQLNKFKEDKTRRKLWVI